MFIIDSLFVNIKTTFPDLVNDVMIGKDHSYTLKSPVQVMTLIFISMYVAIFNVAEQIENHN